MRSLALQRTEGTKLTKRAIKRRKNTAPYDTLEEEIKEDEMNHVYRHRDEG